MGNLAAPTDLRVEHLQSAMGIDVAIPRFSWKLPWTYNGARQTAYQLQVVENGQAAWDTGEVVSDVCHLLPYAGAALKPKTAYVWRVRARSESGEWSDWSADAVFETGFLSSNWTAEWIGAPWYGTQRTSSPCPYMRREFELPSTPIRARLYLSALGLVEASINGKRIGRDALTPGWTDYNKRVYYETYDILDAVHEGTNAVGAILADGWYCGFVGLAAREQYGDRPYLCAQIEVECSDGSIIVIATDSNWRCSTGALQESDLLMGEVYDANREPMGWRAAGFDDSYWSTVMERFEPSPLRIGFPRPPVREIETLSPVSDPVKIDAWMGAQWIVDFGQNLVGTVRIKATAPAGTTMTLRFGEMLDANGRLYTANLRGAKQTDVYVFKGDPEGEWIEPKFTFHGFRYVEISGVPNPPATSEIFGVVLCSDLEETGKFSCSHELINQLQSNIVWGQRGNFLDVPTDCPQRDERLGWTGDAQAFVGTAAFNMNVAPFFAKWLQDLVDSQKEDGRIPPVAPHPSLKVVPDDGGPGWADALSICPWSIYENYADTRLLENTYVALTKYLGFLEFSSDKRIRSKMGNGFFGGFGDWLSIGADTPADLIGTAFYAQSAKITADIAKIVCPNDAAKWEALHQEVVQAFQDRFVTPDGLVYGYTQSGYVLALAFDLLHESQRATAVQELVDDIGKRGWLLTTGFLGTPHLLHVLSEHGRPDVAFRLLLQTKCPSWLYPVTQGATTIWERWDGWTKDKGFQDAGMNSFNHYAFGAVGSWLYQKLAGIAAGSEPGYKNFTLKPHLGGDFANASAEYVSPYGKIRSAWNVEGEQLVWDFSIPANSSANVWIPCLEGDRCDYAGEHPRKGEWICDHFEAGNYRITVTGPGISKLKMRGVDKSV